MISPRFCLWASRDEMWGSSLRWETLAEDKDGGRGNILSSEERETKTFFKRSCICCLFLHKVFHSKTYQLRARIISFAPEPAIWERLSPLHAALARVAQLELKGPRFEMAQLLPPGG